MRTLSIALAAAATLVAASPGATANRAERRAAEIAAAKPAGKPESCIPINQIRETRVRSDQIIDFYMRGRQVYRSTLPNSCPQLGFEEAFSYSTSLSQLCSTDIITVLYRSSRISRGASCGLGEFQPITGVRR